MSKEKLPEGENERQITSDISVEKLQNENNESQISSDISEEKLEHEIEGDVQNNRVGHPFV